MSNLIGCDAILVGGGGGGTPTVLDEFHYVASDVVESGGAVSQMNDQSGNDNHAVQSDGAYQPSYTATDANYNNQSTITFAGDFFNLINAVTAKSDNGFHFWWAGNLTSASSFFSALGLVGSLNTLIFDSSNSRVRLEAARTSTSIATLSYNPSTNRAAWLMRGDGTNIYLYENGILRATTAKPSFNSTFNVSGLRSTIANTSNAVVAEYRLKNENASLATLNTIGASLATKYGFTWNTIT